MAVGRAWRRLLLTKKLRQRTRRLRLDPAHHTWMKSTGTACSCWMCRNLRRDEGPTRDERLADRELRESEREPRANE